MDCKSVGASEFLQIIRQRPSDYKRIRTNKNELPLHSLKNEEVALEDDTTISVTTIQ